MAPRRRKGPSKAVAAAAAAQRQWKFGDLVLAKVKGFPAWPATVSEPEKWGYPADWKKVLVYFFGTQQMWQHTSWSSKTLSFLLPGLPTSAFCNPADVEAFTEEKKELLLGKRQGADFVRAVQEIIESYEKLKKQNQVDEIKVAKVPHGNTNSEPSPEVLVKFSSRVPLQISDHQSKCMDFKVKLGEKKPHHCRNDAEGVAQNEDIEYRNTSEELIGDDVKEIRPISTYSLRKRSGSSGSKSSITQKRPLSERRSTRLYSSNEQRKDIGKLVGVSSLNSVMEGMGRSKRTRRNLDGSKGENLDSPSFAADSSVEGSGSEVVSMDSGDSNEESAVESGSKHGGCDIAAEQAEDKHFASDSKPRKGLDLDIKAVLVKRKRKPNRKRLIGDAIVPVSSTEIELNLDASLNAVASENCLIEDGDQYLPLVKRARVRMSKLSAAEAVCTYSEMEDQSPNQNLPNLPSLNRSFADHDNNTSQLVCMGIPPDIPSSEIYPQCLDVTLQVPKDLKNPSSASSVGSADVEAALPPSKRLHRALEAMSANVTEPCPSSEEASLVVQISTGECHLSPVQSYPLLALDSQYPSGLGMQLSDSVGSGSSVRIAAAATSLDSKTSPEIAGIRFRDDDCQLVMMQNECEMQEKDVENGMDKINVSETPSTASVIVHPKLQVQGPGDLSTEDNETRSRKDEASVIEVFQGIDVSISASNVGGRLNSNSEGTQNLPDTTKCSAASIDHGLNAGAIDLDAPIDQIDKFECSTEVTKCINIEHLRPHDEDTCQDTCKHTSNDVQHHLACKNGSHTFSNEHLSNTEESAPLESSSLSDVTHSSQKVSPPTASGHHISTPASSRNSQSNGTSPAANSRYKKPEFEPRLQLRIQGQSSNSNEANATLSSFEAMLGGLTRTKESIGRATRIAIDCAKFGIAAKVVDSLAHNLERESSLYKRVDLFFLIDSIMQCSRGLKGDAGGMYISIVQSKLPRLLSAAAPSGHTAHENRRQCLKVLRLWLERRILSESILRHHIRELEMMNGSSSAGPYSRRSARTERAFDDPIREMEGMLVDEYGSNSSFQLPGFCMPRMQKDDDEESDSDESFEAVTPEHPSIDPEEGIAASIEKHRHILQDVDGELEMEDVAPPVTQINDASAMNATQSSQPAEQQFQPPFASPPPPPPDIPPVLASLSSSSLSSPPPPHPFPSCLPSHLPNVVAQNSHRSAHDVQSIMVQHVGNPSAAPRDDNRIHEPPSYHSPDFQDWQKQMPGPRNDGSYGRRTMNNLQENDGPWDHQGYPLRQSHHGEQLPYMQSNQRFRSRRDAPPSLHSRFHSPHNRGDGGNRYNHHQERLKPPPHDMRDNWRFSGPYSGPRYHDKPRNFQPGPYDCPPYDPPRILNHGWGYPPRPTNYRNHELFRPPYEGPNFWRP